MKNNFKTMLFSLILMMSMISCHKENVFVEPEVAVEKEGEKPKDVGPVVGVSLPCDFTLDNIQPNSTIIINCLLDLEGQTVKLPANVTIEKEGEGDITNGTINFSQGNIIDANLLSSSLTIAGVKPQVKDPVFTLIAENGVLLKVLLVMKSLIIIK